MQDRAASRATAEDWDCIEVAEFVMDLRGNFIGVTKNDKMLRRFPNPQHLKRLTLFAQFQKRLVAREVFFGGWKREIVIGHRQGGALTLTPGEKAG